MQVYQIMILLQIGNDILHFLFNQNTAHHSKAFPCLIHALQCINDQTKVIQIIKLVIFSIHQNA